MSVGVRLGYCCESPCESAVGAAAGVGADGCVRSARWSGPSRLMDTSYPNTPQAFYSPTSPDNTNRDTPSVNSAISESVNT